MRASATAASSPGVERMPFFASARYLTGFAGRSSARAAMRRGISGTAAVPFNPSQYAEAAASVGFFDCSVRARTAGSAPGDTLKLVFVVDALALATSSNTAIPMRGPLQDKRISHSLFVPERNQRIYLGRAPRRDIAGEGRD